jgi:hypothetical protein
MTIERREQIIVASCLTDHGKLGPCIATALAYAPTYWESVEAGRLAEGIGKVLRRGFVPSLAMIKAMTEPEYRPWIDHPTFKDGLPLSCAEEEARVLLPHYQAKRLVAVVGKCYQEMLDKPDKAPLWALHLKLELGALV